MRAKQLLGQAIGLPLPRYFCSSPNFRSYLTIAAVLGLGQHLSGGHRGAYTSKPQSRSLPMQANPVSSCIAARLTSLATKLLPTAQTDMIMMSVICSEYLLASTADINESFKRRSLTFLWKRLRHLAARRERRKGGPTTTPTNAHTNSVNRPVQERSACAASLATLSTACRNTV
jgi:hypothetical protein